MYRKRIKFPTWDGDSKYIDERGTTCNEKYDDLNAR